MSEVSIERSVEEGLLIARSALRMSAKNRIIIDALRNDRAYDADLIAAHIERMIYELAVENRESAARVAQLAHDVLTPKGAQGDSEGYQANDHDALADRAIVYVRVAENLERLHDDRAYVEGLVEASRADAWLEVGNAIEARLLRDLPAPPDRYYEEDRASRIRALIAINLRELERRRRR